MFMKTYLWQGSARYEDAVHKQTWTTILWSCLETPKSTLLHMFLKYDLHIDLSTIF